MTGFTDYTAGSVLKWMTGQQPMPALPAVFLALFTGVGADAGTGFTEVSSAGTAYARQQVAGTVATSVATASGAVLTFAAVPSWIKTGMVVYDSTATGAITPGTTVLSATGTTVTLSANVASAVSNGDGIVFSAFGLPAGSAPSQSINGAVIQFVTATGAGFGNVIAFGFFDAVTAGNLLTWDYLGNHPWLPCTVSAASPGVITSKAHGFAAADLVVFSTEVGGTAPTFSQSSFTGMLTVVSPATDTFTTTNGGTAVNTSSTGSGMVRKAISQAIPSGVQASFSASTLTLLAA